MPVNVLEAFERIVSARGGVPGAIFFKPLILENGDALSVQANRGAYCKPRDDLGPYDHIEVGVFFRGNRMPRSWQRYCEGPPDEHNLRVFAYIPVELVREHIMKHCPRAVREQEARLLEEEG